jgi:hypothetical protein
MSHMRRRHWAMALWVMTALLLGCSRQEIALESGGTPTPSPTPGEALRRDAQEYARQFGVSEAEAIGRLQYQDGIGDLNAALQANEGDTFGGLWIEHEPAYRIVVHFTRDGQETIRPYLKECAFADWVEVVEVRYTLAELETIQSQAIRELEKLDFDVSCMLTVPKNRVEVPVSDRAWFEGELRRVGALLPEGVKLIVVADGSTAKGRELVLTPPVPGIAFPRQEPVEGIRTSMLAELIGTLHLDPQGGCLRVESLYDGADVLPIWQPEYTLRVEGDQVQVIDEEGEVAVQVGDEVCMSGGYSSMVSQWVNPQIPQDCQGAYFLVGQTVRPNLQHDSDLFHLDVVSSAERTVLFLRRKPALDEQAMDVEFIAGDLVVTGERRCVHIQNMPLGPSSPMLFWPSDWSVQVDGDSIVILDETGQAVAQQGDRVLLRVRAVPHTMNAPVYRQLIDELPCDCLGASWVVEKVEYIQ